MSETTDTPVYPLQPHERQKKRRLQYDITPPDFSRAADDLLKDEDIPLYARTVLAYLVESHKHFEAVNERNRHLLITLACVTLHPPPCIELIKKILRESEL
ncbi:unnamed protein product [Cylicocyclus nassatus]|uniref:Uncharacterized protein n=1 Tax=Cylicocyclus nassatus TaxID=53992 RepID=A0AA36GV25_CYLNA|nr:unnamed protein product [Cylicocyclus nassatus]